MRPACCGLALALLTACRLTGGPGDLDREAGPELTALWDAHGGRDRWLEWGGARCTYHARFPGGEVIELPLLVVFDEGDSVRVLVRGAGGEAVWRSVRPGTGRLELPPGCEVESRPGDPAAVDFALLSFRHGLRLPFDVASRGWALRRVVSSGILARGVPREIRAGPARRPFALGPYLLPLDEAAVAAGAPLERVWYGCCHPRLPSGVHELRLDGWRRVGGVLVATRREHRAPPRRERAASEALEFPPRPSRPEPVVVLREELRDLRLLRREELEALPGIRPESGEEGDGGHRSPAEPDVTAAPPPEPARPSASG